ncbi:MAG: nuclease-related domain-containing protein [Nocardioides sp.]
MIGRAGTGLDDAAWAVNAEVAAIGKEGELATARALDAYAEADRGPTVLHDLRIPISGFTANIDHVVVAGSKVYLIDSKVWRPAIYWTFGGKTRRGWSRFEPADKKTMEMAREHIDRFLAEHGVVARFATPLLVVWPSSTRGSMSVGWYRPRGARAVTGVGFSGYARKRFSADVFSKSADPRIVQALSKLVNR